MRKRKLNARSYYPDVTACKIRANRHGLSKKLRSLILLGCFLGCSVLRAATQSIVSLSNQPKSQGIQTEFDVVSIHKSRPDAVPYTSVPLTSNDYYPPNNGVLTTRNVPLMNFIAFAFKLSGDQERATVTTAPSWVASARFDIEARSLGEPSKDEMRLMVRNLLADRFRLQTHLESKSVLLFGLKLVHEGRLGPQLSVHKSDLPCAYAANGPITKPPTGYTSSVNMFRFWFASHLGAPGTDECKALPR